MRGVDPETQWNSVQHHYLLTKYVEEVGMVSDVALDLAEVLQDRILRRVRVNLHLLQVI